MGGGTEAFPELGRHCQQPDCNLLDFLPFVCDGCQSVFCLDHRSFRSHACPKSDRDSRKVIVCEICSTAIETTGRSGDDEKAMLEKHEKSKECDPLKKKKARCPAKRCREVLTFSNTAVCKSCHAKVCLKHRFPADHPCNSCQGAAVVGDVVGNDSRFLVALAARMGKMECGKSTTGVGIGKGKGSVSPTSTSTVKAR